MNDAELHQRLTDWAAVYGGEQFARLGYAEQARCGRSADVHAQVAGAVESLGGAQQIESLVQSMESCGRWKEGRVVRCEYFSAGLAESERLRRLQRLGLPMSRASYYAYLRTAIAYLHGALSSQVDSVPVSAAGGAR